MDRIFITGIGTNIGKTMVSAIVAEALGANYWKPVQAGFSEQTDTQWVSSVITNGPERVIPEVYKLALPASPHIAARQENIEIDLAAIQKKLPYNSVPLVIEGAGGLLVPLNKQQFVADLAKKLDTKVILVSRNYLGSINHSLLTAKVCAWYGLKVLGWVFNDHFLNYEDEIAEWSGLPVLGRIPFTNDLSATFISNQAAQFRESLKASL